MTINKKKSRVLYRMTVTDPIESAEEVKEIDSETGEEIVRRKKVIKDQKIEVNFLSPTKKQEEASEFHYSVKLSELLKKGIVTKQMLLKQYQDTGGVFSNDTFRELAELYKETAEFKNEYQKIASDNNSDRLDKLDALNAKFVDAMSRIFEIEKEHESLFRNCADTMASNYKFRYFMLNGTILKRENENDFSPLFFVPADKMGNIRFEDQIELFYELEEKEDPAYEKIREMMLLVYTYYFYGYASDEEKMTELIESYQKNKAVEKEMLEEQYKEEVEKQISEIKEVAVEQEKPQVDLFDLETEEQKSLYIVKPYQEGADCVEIAQQFFPNKKIQPLGKECRYILAILKEKGVIAEPTRKARSKKSNITTV